LQSKSKLRKFIRHPADVPLKVSLGWVDENDVTIHPCDNLDNVSLGGLAFKSPQAIPNGQPVKISFPLLNKDHVLTGLVVWNKKSTKGFEIGLEFDDPNELFRLRMIEQICHIEHYRAEVKQHQGRQLTSEQAAKEWIKLYAADFPNLKND
jgi:hypothetical protein